MTTQELLLSAWDWEPSVVVGCAALVAGYIALRGFRSAGLQACVSFLGGTLLLLLALVSPIDTLGDTYLFSAHVVQHFLLALVIPPLWLLGTPRAFAESSMRIAWIGRTEYALAQPFVAWPLGVGCMLVWHLPPLFNAALAHDALHIFQHLSFLVTGVIFWWPILSPITEKRLMVLHATAYLFSACVCCSLLGAVLTFMPSGAYPAYLNPDDRLGILRLVRVDWGLDPETDQQLGGLLMWVPGCLVYLSGILGAAARWYAAAETEA
ncbi:MAG TPA: cytochrome c oxidase assembly protein [Bryobacteraceae bacterium]|nr:cytochrome c oxidase assembly protein [Bryobacteraceae bacterium]